MKKFIISLIVLAGVLMAFAPIDQAKQVFGWIIAERLTVQQGGAVIEGNGLTVTGNVAQTSGNITTDGNVTIADNLIVSAQTSITVTDGYTLTTTGGFHPLTSAGTVTMTLTVPTIGSVIVLENTTNTAINIADGSGVSMAGAVALGQYDTITYISDGRTLVELSRSNN
jgi:hypothetical protein